MPESCSGSDGNNAAVHQDPQLRKILDDYLCDREHAWYFSRCCFRWADGEKPETADTLHAITAEFAMEPMEMPGFCFVTRKGSAQKPPVSLSAGRKGRRAEYPGMFFQKT